MIPEQRWQVQAVTLTPLRHVTSLGCTVSVFRIPCALYGSPGPVEMTALDLSKDPPTRHTAEVPETEEGDLDYRCACVLAQSVGVGLEDG